MNGAPRSFEEDAWLANLWGRWVNDAWIWHHEVWSRHAIAVRANTP